MGVSTEPETRDTGPSVPSREVQDQRFRIMADCSPVMLWMAGTDARCVFFNQPWLEFTGRSMDEELGYGWCEGIHPEDFQNCLDIYMEAFNARRSFTIEYRLRRADGVYRWLLDTGKPYWNCDGSFAGFIGSCVDVSLLREAQQIAIERARLEAQVAEREKATVLLAAANKELEAFAYTVSHDLRAPLRAIDGFLRILADDPSVHVSAKVSHTFKLVRDNARQMGRLIDNLLRFSKTSRQALRRRPVQPGLLVQRILEELRPQWQDRSLRFVQHDLPSCMADPELLTQLLVNLLDNAIKFTRKREGARIEIGCIKSDGDGPAYYVRDNGVGFDSARATKLFGVFQRLHSHAEFEGTGAGLAIAQRIVLRHGGRIWAEAAIDQGACFYFTIPEPTNDDESVRNISVFA